MCLMGSLVTYILVVYVDIYSLTWDYFVINGILPGNEFPGNCLLHIN